MQDQSFSILEYDQLRRLISSGAQTPMGRARVDALEPIGDLLELQHALAALEESVQLRARGISWSFAELTDPAESMTRLRVEGSTLDPLAIRHLASLCAQALEARSAILGERETSPVLTQYVAGLPRELSSLVTQINNKILPGGELDDRASAELSRLRHDINRLRSSITRNLENLMRRSPEAIQDELVTVRNDRFVVPVRSDHRGRVSGVAHGFSSSGATVFIEPLETIEANNELQALREAEEREIVKILFSLTEELRGQLPALETAAEAITQLDVINAKAAFHHKFNCVIPKIDDGGNLDLQEARHPLLEENLRGTSDTVVPVSFSLNEKNNTLVISGANAGGKTVVLKTAGLLSLMALSALPVAARQARVPFYASVLADIGDHQSLAANLSTFTSHIANIARMIELCKTPALVLLDEVGTGTDPEEGSALGVAVVDHFRTICGAHVMATTHYSGLKMYAATEEGVVNASVEFDEKTLRPTYRLIMGVAGSSSGLEIARRFGIPAQMIGTASELVKDSSRQATEYLRRIKRESEEAAALRRALEEERAAVAEKFASLDQKAARRERERHVQFESALQRAITDFERQSRDMLAKVEDRAERLKLEREAQRRAAQLKLEAARVGSWSGSANSSLADNRGVRIVRHGHVLPKVLSAPDKSVSEEQGAEDYVLSEPRQIAVGDRVRLRSFGSVGIVDQVKGDEAEVRVKSLRFREKLEDLELVEAVTPAKVESSKFAKLQAKSGTEIHLKASEENARSELNVIGNSTEEAVEAVDKFLDEASLAQLGQVRIVHGHGTGALRRAISELLTGHPHVARFAPAPPDKGGGGATVVELRS